MWTLLRSLARKRQVAAEEAGPRMGGLSQATGLRSSCGIKDRYKKMTQIAYMIAM